MQLGFQLSPPDQQTEMVLSNIWYNETSKCTVEIKMNLDYQLFELINRFAGQNDMLDQIVLLFSNYGPILFGFAFVWLWFSTSGNKERNRRTVLYALTVMIIALGINKVIE